MDADTLSPVAGNPLAVAAFVGGALLLLVGLLVVKGRGRKDAAALKAQLDQRAAGLPFLAWAAIEAELTVLLRRLHDEWTAGDLKPLRSCLDEDWRLEQQAWLNRTKAQGRIHRLELRSIEAVEPLRFDSGTEDKPPKLWTRLELLRIDEVEGIGKDDPPVRRAELFARWSWTGEQWKLEQLGEDELPGGKLPSAFDDDLLGRHALTTQTDVFSDDHLPSVDELA